MERYAMTYEAVLMVLVNGEVSAVMTGVFFDRIQDCAAEVFKGAYQLVFEGNPVVGAICVPTSVTS